ncbi:MAG: PAS domain S-box protein, partial [Methanosarcinales archaeon]|nr:PAS domain S-box protein [Methanosarcinales archaeon]
GRVYGILSVSIPAGVAPDVDEQSLLSEVADDIAFGLQRIELEEGRRQAEEALVESEGRYRSVFENTGAATVIIEEDATISMTNTEFDKLCGYSKEDVEGMKSWTEFVVEEDLERMKKYHANRRIKGGKPPTEYEFRFVDKEGNIKNILLKIGMLPGAKRSVASLMDITTHKRAEGCIEHLNSVLKAIRNVNQLIVTEKDRDSLLKNACDILIEARGYEAAWLGYLSDDETFDRVVGSGFREDVDRFCESVMSGNHPPCIKKALAGKEIIAIMDKSGECGDCPFKDAGAGKETAVIRIEREGKIFGLLVISLASDVTLDDEEEGLLLEVASDIALALHNMDVEEAHKKAEDQIKASLKEKEVLLREIHHRVKNNLQVVSSLLDMQARDASNKDTIDALTESKDRINAMALIHTQLYEGSDLSEINMNRFVNSLLVQVFQSYSARDVEITPIVSVADYPFPISMAVPGGLLLNELLSNALKHAFVGRKEGTIEVSMTASEEGKINLTVSDDGAGLPPGFDINTTGTLGLRMVKILIEDQLRGSLEVISKEGATFNIEFDTKY